MGPRRFTEAQLRAIRYYIMSMQGIIDDLTVSEDKCWSSYMINSKLTELQLMLQSLKAITNDEVDELFE